MPKFLDFPDFADPADVRERDTFRITRTIAKLDQEIDRRKQEFRGSVSRKDIELDKIESFRDRLIESNVRKQAEPEIVRRNISRTRRILEEYWKDADRVLADTLRPRKAYHSNNFSHVVDERRRPYFTTPVGPRTVFGTEAWMAEFVSARPDLRVAYKVNTAGIVVPCIQRKVRREVIFARGHGHKGHRGRRRSSPHGDIWC